MFTLSQIDLIIASLEEQRESIRLSLCSEVPKVEGLHVCVHLGNGSLKCSVFSTEEGFDVKVTHNDIIGDDNLSLVQKEQIRVVQNYIISKNRELYGI